MPKITSESNSKPFSLFKIDSSIVHGSRPWMDKILPNNTFELNHDNQWKFQQLKLWAFCISLLHFKCNLISFKINIMFRKRPLSNSVLFCWISTFLNTYYSHTQYLLFTINGRHEMKFKILSQPTHVALKAFQIWSYGQPAKKTTKPPSRTLHNLSSKQISSPYTQPLIK